MSHKKWCILFTVTFIAALFLVCFSVILTDPFFHYHAPVSCFRYELENQRSINNGIIRNFDYNAIISGTSMTENFKTSEADALFGKNFIKVPFSGGGFKEINENIRLGIQTHPEVSCVIRSIDQYAIDMDKDYERSDLGSYPTYLYDNNYINDIKYVLNKDIVLGRSLPMLIDYLKGKEGKVLSFDEYSYWASEFPFGAEYVLEGYSSFPPHGEQNEALPQEDIVQIEENIRQNVTSLPAQYPNITFYYFMPPYSAVYWEQFWQWGSFLQHIEIQKIAIEEMLKYPNIKLYSFNTNVDLITDLSKYKDSGHFDAQVSSWILEQIHEGNGLLTQENYMDYLEKMKNFHMNFDYNTLFDQLES